MQCYDAFFKTLRFYRKKDIGNINCIYYFLYIHCFFSFFNYVLRMQRFIIILKKVEVFSYSSFFFHVEWDSFRNSSS